MRVLTNTCYEPGWFDSSDTICAREHSRKMGKTLPKNRNSPTAQDKNWRGQEAVTARRDGDWKIGRVV